MTAASPGPGPNLFSSISNRGNVYRTRKEAFVCSLLGQAAILGAIVYFSSCVIRNSPDLVRHVPRLDELPVIFSGHNGGGGGNRDPLPASHGTPPRASLETPITPATVIVPKEMPKLPVEETVIAAPDVKFPQTGQIGDPLSKYSQWRSDGPGGRGGMGDSCCGGIGHDKGPFIGDGPPGIYPAGVQGVTVPQVIFNPEPSFSEEARKSKTQGTVMLILIVGKDGHPYDIHLGQSLGMGLDEKAIEAVSLWRFRPAMLNGQPVATRIGVQVEFHLY